MRDDLRAAWQVHNFAAALVYAGVAAAPVGRAHGVAVQPIGNPRHGILAALVDGAEDRHTLDLLVKPREEARDLFLSSRERIYNTVPDAAERCFYAVPYLSGLGLYGIPVLIQRHTCGHNSCQAEHDPADWRCYKGSVQSPLCGCQSGSGTSSHTGCDCTCHHADLVGNHHGGVVDPRSRFCALGGHQLPHGLYKPADRLSGRDYTGNKTNYPANAPHASQHFEHTYQRIRMRLTPLHRSRCLVYHHRSNLCALLHPSGQLSS